MGIHETRRANLLWLIDTGYGGVSASLAKALGIQPSQISRVFSKNPANQRNIGTRLARGLERLTGKPLGWMDEPHQFDEPVHRKLGTKGVLLTLPGNKLVPVLDYTQAWEWTAKSDPYPITDRTEIVWSSYDRLSDRAFGLNIEGESMLEDFYPGDTIVVDPEIAPKPGDFVVAKRDADDVVTFRRLRVRGPDAAGKPTLELVPLNDDYPTVVIDSQNPGHIIGTMVEHRKYRRTDRLSPSQPQAVKRQSG